MSETDTANADDFEARGQSAQRRIHCILRDFPLNEALVVLTAVSTSMIMELPPEQRQERVRALHQIIDVCLAKGSFEAVSDDLN